MKKTLATAIILATSFSSTADVRFNGFASIVGGTTMDKNESVFGYNDSISFKPESLFALQASADLGDGLSATAQLMARGENDFRADFEWAYLSYELSEQSQINAGRLRIPFYRYSDFLDVGYAYNWLRPPSSVYRLPFSTYDGISYVNNHLIGDWESSIQLTYGSYEGGVNLVAEDDPSKLDGITGINWTVNNYWLTARAVYMVAETSISFENDPTGQLTGGLALFGATFPDHAARLEVNEDDSSFFGFGVSIDYNDVLFDVEYTEVEVEDSLVAKQEQYYVSLGYRMDDITVFATVEHSEDSHDFSMASTLPEIIPANPAAGIPEDVYMQAIFSGMLA